jgi:hypothetical protein
MQQREANSTIVFRLKYKNNQQSTILDNYLYDQATMQISVIDPKAPALQRSMMQDSVQ